ncbi:uncharacterized protein [Primulina huaijiensis]|uniref:uncharacterized protein n=1 Tax=Primulina huaijiensis TaxID=1492673 RepID=UPI003CC7022A
MNKQDMLRVQTSVLRVNIHCEGCKEKVKKKLQKIQGVYKVNIDAEQGKVFVSGNVDPAVLIEKLEKSGKHAELWGTQNGQNPANFLNNLRFENPTNGGKDNRSQKGGKDQQKSGHQQNPLLQQIQKQNIKGVKDMKFLGKDNNNNKSGKLNFSEDEEDEDDFDDEFDDDSDEEFTTGHQVSNKAANGAGGGGHDGHLKGKTGAKNGKKGGGFDFLKGMLGKTGAKDGSAKNGGKIKAEKGNQDQVGGKKGGKNVGFVIGDGKSGAKNGKNDGKNNDSWSKKGGDKFDGLPKMDNKQLGFKELNATNHKGLNGGNVGMMGNYPMGHFPASAQGLHMGNFPGAAQGRPGDFGPGPGNPYNQQQYMAQMMMMNQQRANGNDMYHPMMFNRPTHPGMNYGPPPPANDKFTHIFSDENTDSCSIM